MMESLLLSTPTIDSDYDATVFGKADGIDERAIFCESDQFDVSFELVEVYPSSEDGLLCDWPEDFNDASNLFCTLDYFPENDFSFTVMETTGPLNPGLVSVSPSSSHEIIVTVYDGISGGETTTSAYDVKQSWGYDHRVAPADPNPFAPFTNVFQVLFARNLHQGDDFVSFVRRIVTLGVIPEDVPQLYTMTTNPHMVFSVIRDPPGGMSSTTLHEGSTLSVNMEIQGMHAGDLSKGVGYGLSGSLKASTAAVVSPMGVGLTKDIIGLNFGFESGRSSSGPTVSVERATSQAFELGFTFDMEISTSGDSQHAGQPQDLILGGGMNLKILQASKNNRTTIFSVLCGRNAPFFGAISFSKSKSGLTPDPTAPVACATFTAGPCLSGSQSKSQVRALSHDHLRFHGHHMSPPIYCLSFSCSKSMALDTIPD